MKKSIITPLLLLLAIGASAQLRIDLRAGATASAIGDSHLTMGLRGGAAVSYLFANGIGLRTGLFYAEKGGTDSDNVFERRRSLTTRLTWADLPVEVAGAIRLSERSKLELHGGLYVARLLRAKLPATASCRARGWDTGVGAGFDFVVGHFIAGPQVQYGLTKIVTSGSSHNIAYSLTLGYRF